jgi:hypothetical protein
MYTLIVVLALLAACLYVAVRVNKLLGALALAAVCVYGALFIELGERTFVQHVVRIARTPEVEDLADAIETERAALALALRSTVFQRLAAIRPGSRASDDAPKAADGEPPAR